MESIGKLPDENSEYFDGTEEYAYKERLTQKCL